MTLYLIQIEPVYNQATGYYHMITNNINNANIFRQELLKYKNFLLDMNNYENNDLSNWIFSETIYVITNKTKTHYDGYCIASNIYTIDKFDKLKQINWEKKPSKIENCIVEFCRMNWVYYPYKDKCKLERFNILSMDI